MPQSAAPQTADQNLHAQATNLDYANHLKLSKKVPEHFWLLDSDIDTVLRHELDIDPITKEAKKAKGKKAYVVSALALESKSIGAALYQVRAKRFEKSLTGEYVVYVPVNRGNNHWAFLKVEVSADEKTINASYKDSLSGSGINQDDIRKKITEALKYKENVGAREDAAFPELTGEPIVDISFSSEQRDGWTCGYRTSFRILESLQINNHITQVDSNNSTVLRDRIFTSIRTANQLPEDTSQYFKQALKRTFSEKEFKKIELESFEKTKPGTVECPNGDKINIIKEDAGYALSTPSNKEETLELMVKKMAELMDETGTKEKMTVTMEAGDEKTLKFLKAKCQQYGINNVVSKLSKPIPVPATPSAPASGMPENIQEMMKAFGGGPKK
jgi:hypothetical protein